MKIRRTSKKRGQGWMCHLLNRENGPGRPQGFFMVGENFSDLLQVWPLVGLFSSNDVVSHHNVVVDICEVLLEYLGEFSLSCASLKQGHQSASQNKVVGSRYA